MTHPPMSRAEFLALSTKVCEDLRRWVVEAAQYHNLTPDRLAALTEAAGIIDQQTTLLVALKPKGPAE
jgi:predicted signal transduction protein with EAL and GGDEF domain